MSNYATKSDWKNATGLGMLDVAKKADLSSLKSDAEKLNVVHVNLSKLSEKWSCYKDCIWWIG